MPKGKKRGGRTIPDPVFGPSPLVEQARPDNILPSAPFVPPQPHPAAAQILDDALIEQVKRESLETKRQEDQRRQMQERAARIEAERQAERQAADRRRAEVEAERQAARAEAEAAKRDRDMYAAELRNERNKRLFDPLVVVKPDYYTKQLERQLERDRLKRELKQELEDEKREAKKWSAVERSLKPKPKPKPRARSRSKSKTRSKSKSKNKK